MNEIYNVKFTEYPIDIDLNCEKEVWKDTEPIVLKNYMGKYPEHFPNVYVKLRYDYNFIYVLFKVTDKNIRSVAVNHFDPVFEDSCVEFFFAPDKENNDSYFNLEVNCSGKVLFGYRLNKLHKSTRISTDEIKQLNVSATFKDKLIDEEIKETTEWAVQYKIPFTLIEKYLGKKIGNNLKEWRGNFYKCADMSSTPHWLTWNKVEYSEPNFHLPEYFGRLLF
jgi:hypothetical protein